MLQMIEKYRITSFCAPPTIYRFMIKADLSKHDLSSLKYLTTAGEAVNPEVFHQMRSATGLTLMEGFGQTETTLTVFNPIGTEPKPGSMGKPSPAYKIKLVDSEGKETPLGSDGEICIDVSEGRPYGLFREYYRDPENTKNAVYDGLYHSGDVAHCDEDGYLYFVGRTDDVIKSSGYRIGPFEIENVIMEYGGILECAVVGVPDLTGERGQLVKAVIVMTADKRPKTEEEKEALSKEIQQFVKKQTAPYKYPRIIEFRDELPKTISGKVKRTELR
jgi:acetyl-CoA synthetase